MQLTEALRSDLWATDEDGRSLSDLLATSEGRRVLTKNDPLLFAWVYFRHHVEAQTDQSVTVCDFHLDLLAYAQTWSQPMGRSREHRHCFIAPRGYGKSTWIFLLLPMWAAAHGHRKFVAAFSDSGAQAETHLHTFKMELRNNERLKADFPEFTSPMKVGESSKEMLNNRNQIMQANGFIFMARGADSNSLGMKLGALRPDVLLFDDIEPSESNYSDLEARKRKDTLISALFALNTFAVVGIVGTTTMPNSLIDQMRKVGLAKTAFDGDPEMFRETLEPEQRWVEDENIQVHYWPAVLDDNGSERALWPEKETLEDFSSIRHTRDFQKNWMNRPVSLDGGYWDDSDIEIDEPMSYKHTLVSVDPAVTTKKASDYTGIAVVSLGDDNRIYVRHAEQVKLGSEDLKHHVSEVVKAYGCQMLVIETNQGGDLWRQVFNGVPCKYRPIRATEKKEVRASRASDFYKKGHVAHTAHFHIAEEQMLAFPHVTHDDVVDAITTGVLAYKKNKGGISVTTKKYTEV